MKNEKSIENLNNLEKTFTGEPYSLKAIKKCNKKCDKKWEIKNHVLTETMEEYTKNYLCTFSE